MVQKNQNENKPQGLSGAKEIGCSAFALRVYNLMEDLTPTEVFRLAAAGDENLTKWVVKNSFSDGDDIQEACLDIAMGALVHIRSLANSEGDNATEELAEVIMSILADYAQSGNNLLMNEVVRNITLLAEDVNYRPLANVALTVIGML